MSTARLRLTHRILIHGPAVLRWRLDSLVKYSGSWITKVHEDFVTSQQILGTWDAQQQTSASLRSMARNGKNNGKSFCRKAQSTILKNGQYNNIKWTRAIQLKPPLLFMAATIVDQSMTTTDLFNSIVALPMDMEYIALRATLLRRAIA